MIPNYIAVVALQAFRAGIKINLRSLLDNLAQSLMLSLELIVFSHLLLARADSTSIGRRLGFSAFNMRVVYYNLILHRHDLDLIVAL